MSKSDLFKLGDIKNHPRRSAFDMNRKVAFTAKVGEILPVDWTFVLPGDKFKLGIQSFTRTAPVQTCAFQRIKEYYEWFYVPIRMLWRYGAESLTHMTEELTSAESYEHSATIGDDFAYTSTNTLSAALKTLDSSSARLNAFGYSRSVLSAKLLSYLRYGYQFKQFSNSTDSSTSDVDNRVSALPLLAYHKFYYDHFRNPQWERKKASNFNIDYYTGQGALPWSFSTDYFIKSQATLLDIHYCNWQKDMFFGAMPSSQFGSVSAVNVSFSTTPTKIPVSATNKQGDSVSVTVANTIGAGESSPLGSKVSSSTIEAGTPLEVSVDLDNALGEFSILQLRAAEALQRWKEITQAGDQSYVGQLYAHFGVKASKELNNESTRLCGTSSDVVISEIVNQNLVDSPADIRGKGQASCDGQLGTYEFKEHGVLMCLYHAVPLLDYEQMAPDPQLLVTTAATSFPVPEFDNIGLEEVPTRFLSSSKTFENIFKAIPRLGYAPRYLPWKTTTDIVLGGFDERNVDLYSWVAPVNSDFLKLYFGVDGTPLKAMTHYWFKVYPGVLNNIFAVKADSGCGTDYLRINSYHVKSVVRNLDYDGMPY